ncbi:MAG: o-succinylbenzoate synthase [Candidatus Kapaibacterium sp.]|nr:MAG: o-succinylbenzoate synthase [Candidatus Kapabacteria bacterium]
MTTSYSASYSAELWRYALPLREPLTIPNGALSTRHGLILVLTDSAGNQGFGEIAPLQSLHTETLAEAEAQILSALQKNTLLQEHSSQLFPSVRCGVEMALYDLTLPRMASSRQQLQSLNALLSGAKETLLSKAEKAVQDGYKTLKIKVGRHSLDDDIASVRAIRERVGQSIRLRLDANRTWSLEAALYLGYALQDCAIDYIEEPCKNVFDSAEFASKTCMRVAFDETLSTANTAEFEARLRVPDEALAAYILKPSVLGGIEKASHLAREANERGLLAVVSSVFESGIALRLYAHVQQSWNAHIAQEERTVACGLDTFSFLADDTLLPRFSSTQGVVNVSELFARDVVLNSATCTCLARVHLQSFMECANTKNTALRNGGQ